MAIPLAVSATVQTPVQFTPTLTSVAGLKPGLRTFSLTGALGTAVLNGDAVNLWGSNDGGTTFQPLRQNGAPVQLNYGNPEVVINDACDHYATQRVAVAQGSALAAVGLNGEAAANPLVQAGAVTLSSGTATVTGKILTSSSIIDPAVVTYGGTMTNFAYIAVTSINTTAGSFVLTAKTDGDVTLGSSSPVVNYIIVG